MTWLNVSKNNWIAYGLCKKKVGVIICLKIKDQRLWPKKSSDNFSSCFFLGQEYEIKNNISWSTTLSLAEYSRGTLLKSQSTMPWFSLQASDTTVIAHSSCHTKHLKIIKQNMLKEHYLWLWYDNAQAVLNFFSKIRKIIL